MNKQTIQNIIEFMRRTELKGNEAQAFLQCIQALKQELEEDKENGE